MNSLNSYFKRWSRELNAILLWISIYNIWGVSFVLYDYKCNLVIAMCASFLKTFVWCKFGARWLNVLSMTLEPNFYLFCDLWNDIFESFMTLEPDAIALCFIHNNSMLATPKSNCYWICKFRMIKCSPKTVKFNSCWLCKLWDE